MTQENAEHRPAQPAFAFTEREELFGILNQKRFEAILFDPATTIHTIQETSNSFGEFLFITISRKGSDGHVTLTFYGLGYHEQRERWIGEEWRWYESAGQFDHMRRTPAPDETRARLEERRNFVQSAASDAEPQSKRGQLYELMADLTDEDGALTDLEDMGWWLLSDDGDE